MKQNVWMEREGGRKEEGEEEEGKGRKGRKRRKRGRRGKRKRRESKKITLTIKLAYLHTLVLEYYKQYHCTCHHA